MKNSERATGVAGVTPNGDLDASTRRRVLSSILEHGPSTAAELSGRLGLTPAGIRRHLDVLLAYGHVEAREQRIYGARGRGRPAKDFVLTDAGRAVFYTAYDDLAISALGFLAEAAGPDAVARFAESRIAAVEERYRAKVADADSETSPAQALAAALSDDGYVASTLPVGARRAALPAPLPGGPRRREVSSAVRGRNRSLLPGAGRSRPAPRHHRPRRRCLHDSYPACLRHEFMPPRR